MSHSVKLSSEIVDEAKLHARTLHRSVPGQIEHWAKLGKMVEDNPDLSYSMIKQILLSQQELKTGKVEPYQFD